MEAVLSRNQLASSDFFRASERLRLIATDGHGEGLASVAGELIQAIHAFGLSELEARRGERLQALKLGAGTAREATRLRDAYNDKGLRTLKRARAHVKLFREELASYPDAKLGGELKEFQQELREQLAELEVSASDVAKIDSALADGFALVAKDATGLPDYLDQNLRELEKVRRSANRGAVENIPIWKIIAIVVAFGIWIWALFRCHWWGSCDLREGLAYFIVFWIAVLIARFC
ncbi:MAG: hypothetical protein AABM30_03320 [Actinomycetota bacterium]